MNEKPQSYGILCSLFYDAFKKFAPQKEVDFYASFIQNKTDRVLEAMSGSGRLKIPLIERGYAVDGVDNSAIMLERCRQRFAERGVSGDIYQQSLEDLSLPHKYAVVTIAVGSFQLIVERDAALRALQNLRAHMHAGGSLLIDIFVPDTAGDARSVRMAHLDEGSTIRLTTRYFFDVEARIAEGYCQYELIKNGEIMQEEQELIKVTWYSDDEITALLNQAGFEVRAFYDETFRSSGPSRVVHAIGV